LLVFLLISNTADRYDEIEECLFFLWGKYLVVVDLIKKIYLIKKLIKLQLKKSTLKIFGCNSA